MVEKLILTSDLQQILEELGDYRDVKNYGEVSSPIDYERQKFRTKEEYANLVIVQRCLILINDIRSQVAVVGRSEIERRDRREVPRITSGASVLFSSSPFQHAQSILDRTVEHRITTPIVRPHRIDFVSVNDVKGGYVFLVRTLMVNPKEIDGGKEPDKELQFMSIEDADSILRQEKREMERNILKAATQEHPME